MTRILILGADRQLARTTARVLLGTTDAMLTLYLRRASRLANPDTASSRLIAMCRLNVVALMKCVRPTHAASGCRIRLTTCEGGLPSYRSHVRPQPLPGMSASPCPAQVLSSTRLCQKSLSAVQASKRTRRCGESRPRDLRPKSGPRQDPPAKRSPPGGAPG